MASKEATIYIIDQGKSTAKCRNGRSESDLEYSMKYVWDKIATVMAAERKTGGLGIIGLRNDNTDVPLEEPEGYEHIAVLKELGLIDMSQLPALKRAIVPSSTDAGDAISAIIVAVDMIGKFTMLKSGKPGKFTRKIVLVTTGGGPLLDADDLDDVVSKINELDIELAIIGIDFDDPDYGFKEEDKPERKKQNEETLRTLAEKCNKAVFGTTAEAVEMLVVPIPKITRPYATYKGKLSLGDFEKYPQTALYIDVERYFKTKTASAPSASNFVTRSGVLAGNGEGSAQSSGTIQEDTDMANVLDLSAVKYARTYKVNDASAPGGKRDVDRDDLAKGYEYGRTAVPISESDQNITKLETVESFTIIGFVPSDKYARYLNMGSSCITVAQSINDKARMALSSLIHALFELDSYAVARIVTKAGKDPEIVLLAPELLDGGNEALIDVPLPFAEDVRIYQFPPLDRVVTTSGATVSKHRNLPSNDLQKAMSDYVDAMDLSTFGKDDEGNPKEYMEIDETYNPVIHRIGGAIRKRAIHPSEPIDPPPKNLMKWSSPPEELIARAKSELGKLEKAALVKKVPPKKKGGRFRREPIKPLSGLDVQSLLDRDRPKKITKENAIPELKHLLSKTTSDNDIQDAANQMSRIICEIVKDTTGETGDDRALENIRVLREELMALETPEIYNDFMQEFKRKLLKGDLGGERKEFFLKLRFARLGLVDSDMLEHSEVSPEEAVEFYSLSTKLPSRGK
ncbi:SPOC like C-terminal domain-containing protein [Tricladium varicosporioides]|nr:SPOC like C-terminal domain-containing protein [Hymenoscyphus varicosporioides]